ncbi:DNA repair protein RecO [compost metagenome]
MLHQTRGIVLKTTSYSESSVVVKILTEKLGIQTYLIHGVKKPKAKIPMNLLQSLHLLDMIVYHKAGVQLQRMAEARPCPAFRTIPYDLVKNTMVQFLNEVLYKAIGEGIGDEQLFDFIYHALCWFDETDEAVVNFHLSFLMKLSKYLGFAPHFEVHPSLVYFDLQEGAFSAFPPVHPYFIEKEDANWLRVLFLSPFEKLNELKIPNPKRRHLLAKLLVYYSLHTASMGQIKSHQILEEVLS